jgi:hypothetical protein
MIVVEIKLASALGRDRDRELGTMVIENITSERTHLESMGRKGDYCCRMYRKGALNKFKNDSRLMVYKSTPTREGQVLGHARLAEPVQNLVAKALKEMGYG